MPATLLQATSISKSLGRVVVLDNVDLRADSDSRIGLIGPNGAGKSTLLRIAAGLERPDQGDVRRHGLVGYLPQVAGGSESARTSIWRRIGLLDAERELSRLEARLEAGELEAVEAHGDALARWVALGGEDAEARVATALAELGLGADLLERPTGSLSGGQLARVGLAALQAARFDLLLLDEPTNHLDADGLERFGRLLREGGRPFVVVSHDRALLEESVEEIVELDGPSGSAEVYGGGWNAYERERRLRERRERNAHETAVAERERAVAVEREIRRRASRMSSRMRSRPADGDKNSREWVRSRADGAASRARKIGERAERIDVPPAPWRPPRLRLTIEASETGAGEIALEEVLLRRGAFELGPLSLHLALGDRLALEGPNGSGKSTLLAALAGELEPVAGRIRRSRGAAVALLGQQRQLLSGARTPLAAAREIAGLEATEARTLLAGFGIDAIRVERPAATLSPGERTRAELALLVRAGAGCLLLDEPTNHLDIESLEVLEQALGGWPGTLVVASHDRRLREALDLSRRLSLELPAQDRRPRRRRLSVAEPPRRADRPAT